LQMPQGTVWSNNSCAYDCVFFNSALHLVPWPCKALRII
jgi:hypothetical protein